MLFSLVKEAPLHELVRNPCSPQGLCQSKGCESYRKSIRKDKLEGDFEIMLEALEPSERLVGIVRTMFKDAWDQRLGQAKARSQAAQAEVKKLDKQIDTLVDRIVESQNDRVDESL